MKAINFINTIIIFLKYNPSIEITPEHDTIYVSALGTDISKDDRIFLEGQGWLQEEVGIDENWMIYV